MNTIQTQWEDFKIKVIPKTASNIQVSEMKKSFYAGACSILAIMMTTQDDNLQHREYPHMFEALKQLIELFAIESILN